MENEPKEVKINHKVLVDPIELANLQLQVESYSCARKQVPYEPIENELWQPIPKAKGYFVSNLGRIRHDWTTKKGEFKQIMITPFKRNRKYHIELTIAPSVKMKFQLHILVAHEFLVFVGMRGKRHKRNLKKNRVEVKDGNYLNCKVDNLRWISKRIKKKPKPLNKMREYINENGEVMRKPSIISTEDCLQVLELRKLGISQAVIGHKMGITQQMVSNIIRGKLDE
jgi:hypothetical protein